MAVDQITIGRLRLSRIVDGSVQLRAQALFPDVDPARWADHPEYVDEHGYLISSSGGLLIEDGDRALLMDAGFGPVSVPADQTHPALGAIRGGDLPAHLARIGRRPETLDAVLASHAHADHIGWTAWPGPLSDRPVLMTEREWRGAGPSEAVTAEILDAVRPRVRTVRDGEEVFPGVSVLALPGHTLGHAGLRIESGRERLLVLGDALLTALQVAHPDWTKLGDESAAEATRTRHWILRELAGTGTPAYAGHFDGDNFGRVERRGDAYRWLPLT